MVFWKSIVDMTVSKALSQEPPDITRPSRSSVLRTVGIYLGATAVANLIWESLQLPLYTIWTTGTVREIAFAVMHCTVGDVLIASGALFLAIIVGRCWSWPLNNWTRVTALTIVFGVGYTAFSEWLNIYVRHVWAYAHMMPVFRIGRIDLGLSPLAQWLVVPSVALVFVKWRLSRVLKYDD